MAAGHEIVLLDASVIISCGRRDGSRFRALAREARRRDASFRITPQVYAEVTGDGSSDGPGFGTLPVDDALRAGWMTVTESPSYDEPEVSTVMDQARRFIASASDRPEDVIEKADTEIVGVALEVLVDDRADRVTIVTNDVPLGEAAETLIPRYGFETQQVSWLTGGDLVDEPDEDFVPDFE